MLKIGLTTVDTANSNVGCFYVYFSSVCSFCSSYSCHICGQCPTHIGADDYDNYYIAVTGIS